MWCVSPCPYHIRANEGSLPAATKPPPLRSTPPIGVLKVNSDPYEGFRWVRDGNQRSRGFSYGIELYKGPCLAFKGSPISY
ncbi:hypothetical protein ACOSQ2_021149 [Xanthoceras sorbifolium]